MANSPQIPTSDLNSSVGRSLRKRPKMGRAMSLPRDLWPGPGPQLPGPTHPDEFESRDSFLLSLRLRFILFLRRLGIRR
jgi:hypothetical protein